MLDLITWGSEDWKVLRFSIFSSGCNQSNLSTKCWDKSTKFYNIRKEGLVFGRGTADGGRKTADERTADGRVVSLLNTPVVGY
jgi:hypothetical protein